MLPDGLLPDLDFPFTTEQLEDILSAVEVSFPFVYGFVPCDIVQQCINSLVQNTSLALNVERCETC
jgi:hypothetical protein